MWLPERRGHGQDIGKVRKRLFSRVLRSGLAFSGTPWHPTAVPRVQGNGSDGVPEEVRFGGRVVGPAALRRIRQFLRANASTPQGETARTLCKMFDFPPPNRHPSIHGF